MIFDCHVHLPSPSLGVSWEWEPFAPDLESALGYLRSCGVTHLLANTYRGEAAASSAEMVAGNDEIYRLARAYPGEIVPVCLVNPNFPAQALDELRRCHDEYNFVWVGELCGYVGGFSYDTPAFHAILQLAGDLNMVVHIHNDDALDMERLCAQFPENTFVLAHLGESPEDVRARIGLAGKYPNLYLDISGNGFERMGVLELAVQVAGAERVLYGSDFSINDPAGVIARIQRSHFEDETKRKLLGENLVRLLHEHGWVGA